MKRKTEIILLVVLIVVFSFSVINANDVNEYLPWHYLQQIAVGPSDGDEVGKMMSVDSNKDGMVDNANNATYAVVADSLSSTDEIIDVSGVLKLDSTNSLTCDSTSLGSLRYNSGEGYVEFCDGSEWSELGSGSYEIPTETKVVFSYTGDDQFYTVPEDVNEISVRLWGAGGGGCHGFSGTVGYGGAGAYAEGVISVTPGEILKVIVGQGGIAGNSPSYSSTTYGGGGAAKAYNYNYIAPGSGGGRSAIRRSTTELITAAGGGGAGGYAGAEHGGAGGAEIGQDGYGVSATENGKGATQSSGGSGGIYNGGAGTQFQGGNGGSGSYHTGAGGGGGYYGGGGGGASYGTGGYGGAGGGGSSYIGGTTWGNMMAGSGTTPGNADDILRNGAGKGGPIDGDGSNGIIIIEIGNTVEPIMVDRTEGTPFGTVTARAGLNSVFDNYYSITQENAASTPTDVMSFYVGKDWGSGNSKNIKGFKIFSSSNYGFFGSNAGSSVLDFTLQGSNDNSNWVDLGSTSTNEQDTFMTVELFDVDSATTYRYHRVFVRQYNSDSNGNTAELEFYE